MIRRKEKETQVSNLMIGLTNMRILISKGIITEEEYAKHTSVVIKVIQESQNNKGDFNDIITRLSQEEV